MKDLMTEREFEVNWEKADGLLCKDADRQALEHLMQHILTVRRPMFSEEHYLRASLCDLTIAGMFYEYQYGTVETNPFKMVGLADIAHSVQGSYTYIWTHGIIHRIGGGHMRVDGFRFDHSGSALLIDWRAMDDSWIPNEFGFLMSVKFGKDSDGIASVSELLESLQQWDALADVVGDSTSDEVSVRTRFMDHFGLFGDIRPWITPALQMSPKTYREIIYTVRPMWSESSDFLRVTDLASFLKLPKPLQLPKPVVGLPEYFGCIPRGNSDYFVDYDKRDSEWAKLYSPRLGIYYMVTVKFSGTTVDDRTDLLTAHKVRSSPREYMLDEMSELHAHQRLNTAPTEEPDRNPLCPFSDSDVTTPKSSPDEVDGWILDYEPDDCP